MGTAEIAERQLSRELHNQNLRPDGKPMFEQYLPVRYNANSVMVARVDADEEKLFNFDLTTKK